MPPEPMHPSRVPATDCHTSLDFRPVSLGRKRLARLVPRGVAEPACGSDVRFHMGATVLLSFEMLRRALQTTRLGGGDPKKADEGLGITLPDREIAVTAAAGLTKKSLAAGCHGCGHRNSKWGTHGVPADPMGLSRAPAGVSPDAGAHAVRACCALLDVTVT